MKTLQEWLDWCEQLHPVAIDMGLDRVKTVADRMALRFDCPVITVAGTNGKGSTCAMLEAVLLQAGYRTGVYTSPHLVHFEERCRLHGESASAEAFAEAFAAVEAVRGDVSLTYFEFSTLAILRLMAQAHLDVAILEVGLGGRLDAVNIIDADCAVITSIDLDHMAILGKDRERIGFEKAGIMRGGRPVIVSDPVPPQSVIDHAAAVGAELWLFGRDFNFSGDKQQWAWAGRDRRYSGMAYPALRGANQLINAAGVLAALEALRQRIPITAQAVRNGLAMVELPGRFQIVPGQPVLVLDVAHNPHSPTWTPWVFIPPPTRFLGPWPTKICCPCCKRSTRWWTNGISPICPCPVPPKRPICSTLGRGKTPAQMLLPARTTTLCRPCRRPSKPQTRLIESSSLAPSIPWAVFCKTAFRVCKPNTSAPEHLPWRFSSSVFRVKRPHLQPLPKRSRPDRVRASSWCVDAPAIA
jgi:dihydrofolate synthase/folylpolyglutamate synthase